MLKKIGHWFHHLFNPHCNLCLAKQELELKRVEECKSCETLKEQLLFSNNQIEKLLDSITNQNKPVITPSVSTEEHKRVAKPTFGWDAHRRKLEQRSREENNRLVNKIKEQRPEIRSEIDRLEKELEVPSIEVGEEDASRADSIASGNA